MVQQRIRFLDPGLDTGPIENIGHRLLYLKLRLSTQTFCTLMSKWAKCLAIQDCNAYWAAAADTLEKTWREGRSPDLCSMARIYAGKCRPAGIVFPTDHQGNPFDSPEARQKEWVRGF